MRFIKQFEKFRVGGGTQELTDKVVKVVNDYLYILEDEQCEVEVNDDNVEVKTKHPSSFFETGNQFLEFKDRVKADLPGYEMKIRKADMADNGDKDVEGETVYNYITIYFDKK